MAVEGLLLRLHLLSLRRRNKEEKKSGLVHVMIIVRVIICGKCFWKFLLW